jgi:hypothetical protein
LHLHFAYPKLGCLFGFDHAVNVKFFYPSSYVFSPYPLCYVFQTQCSPSSPCWAKCVSCLFVRPGAGISLVCLVKRFEGVLKNFSNFPHRDRDQAFGIIVEGDTNVTDPLAEPITSRPEGCPRTYNISRIGTARARLAGWLYVMPTNSQQATSLASVTPSFRPSFLFLSP